MEEKDLFWQEITSQLKEILSEGTYKNWVEPVKPTRIGKDTITLAVPNTLTKNYWDKHLSGYILQISLDKFGMEYLPNYILVPEEEHFKPEVEIEPSTVVSSSNIEEQSIPTNNQLNPNYTFDNFVIGEDNKMASVAALAVVDGPGTTYNPFLIYGGVGLGKTHLMQAIGNEIQKRNPATKIKYATSESFVNDFITSIQNGSQQEFRDMYRKIDVLLIDDIQFLSNKDKTQEEFFHTFNALFNNEKQIVLTSDRLPNDIDNLEDRLISRFKSGLSTDITPPDLETRIAILRKKASNDNLDIDSKTLTYIANSVDTNIRELEGALVRVIAYAAIQGKEINTNLAAEALQSIVGEQENKPITVEQIIETVSLYYDVSVNDIKGKKRHKEIVNPRQIGMYLSRELTDLSFPKIGEQFGNKNHTTVIHAYEKISNNLENDDQLKYDIEQLKKQFHQ